MPSVNLPLKASLVLASGTQCAAAAAMGMDPTHLSRLIRGFRQPSKTDRRKLAKLLGKDKLEALLEVDRNGGSIPKNKDAKVGKTSASSKSNDIAGNYDEKFLLQP